MATDPPIHPYETLTGPHGQQADIDVDMVHLVGQLWRLGYATVACCQDVGEATAALRAHRDTPLGYGGDGFIAYHLGYALLKMPTADARHLVARLGEDPIFSDRVRRPWQPGSWRMNVALGPDGFAPDTLIHFPREQIPVLVGALRPATYANRFDLRSSLRPAPSDRGHFGPPM